MSHKIRKRILAKPKARAPSSNASTQLLDVMHYRGLLRVARREGGTRIYAAREPAALPDPAAMLDPAAASARMDALVDLVVHKYAPLPARTLSQLLSLLGGGAPQWRGQRAEALARAKQRLAGARVVTRRLERCARLA